MRRVLTIFSIIIIILIVFSQCLLPGLLEKTAESRLQEASKADRVEVGFSTVPALKMALGRVDAAEINAENAQLGNIRVSKLHLSGEGLQVNILNLISYSGNKEDGSKPELFITGADKLVLTGEITEENLADFLQKKVDKIEDIQVKMTPESVTATGKVKLGGQMADLSLEGVFFEQNGSVFFRMTKLDIRNALFGHAAVGNFFGDIVVLNLRQLPFEAEYDRVEQMDGKVILTASRHNR